MTGESWRALLLAQLEELIAPSAPRIAFAAPKGFDALRARLAARGEVVDEAALAQALMFETIGGAALDVFEREPIVNPMLAQCDNLVMLPHLGSATREARQAMGFRVLDNLNDFFEGNAPRDRVA